MCLFECECVCVCVVCVCVCVCFLSVVYVRVWCDMLCVCVCVCVYVCVFDVCRRVHLSIKIESTSLTDLLSLSPDEVLAECTASNADSPSHPFYCSDPWEGGGEALPLRR